MGFALDRRVFPLAGCDGAGEEVGLGVRCGLGDVCLAGGVFDDPLIDGLCDRRESVVLPGPSGIGKSNLLSQIGIACGNPSVHGLLTRFAVKKPLKSVVIQSENTMKHFFNFIHS